MLFTKKQKAYLFFIINYVTISKILHAKICFIYFQKDNLAPRIAHHRTNMKTQIITILTVIFFNVSLAQVKHQQSQPNYSLAAKFSSNNLKKSLFSLEVEPNWIDGSEEFWYEYSTSKEKSWYLVNPETGKKTELFDRQNIGRKLQQITGSLFDPLHLPLQNIQFVQNGIIKFQIFKGKQYSFNYNIKTKELIEIKEFVLRKPVPKWANFNPDTTRVYYSKNFNLYWMDYENYLKALKNENDPSIIEYQITNDGVQYYSWGDEPFSTSTKSKKAEEQDRKTRKYASLLWSPNGKYFSITKKDNRKINDLWVIHSTNNKRPTLETFKYQMPGEIDSSETELFIFDSAKHGIHKVLINEFKNQSLTVWSKFDKELGITEKKQIQYWLGNDNEFYVARTSRDLKRVDFLAIEIDGTVRSLIQERDMVPITTKKPLLLEERKQMIYWSERDGWGHFYLYNTNGKLIKQLTKGEFHCEEALLFEKKTNRLFFRANGKEPGIDPYYNFYYSLNIDKGTINLLTPGNFDHHIKLSKSGRYFIDNFSRVNTAPNSILYSISKKFKLNLEEADLTDLYALGYQFPEPFKVKAADSITDLFGVIYKPYDFDSTKTYPIIAHVYPGPHTEAVSKSFEKNMSNTDQLAQVGFIVITVGNRGGSPLRSKAYHTYGYGNMRDYAIDDKKTAIEQLGKQHTYIDTSKVGITGHSGGGFLAATSLLIYPDFFKVAVAESGNHDNNIYNYIWGESNQGVQEIISEKKDTSFVYKVETNSILAKKLKGHLLLVTGDEDNNVNPAHTIRLANALINANKYFDLLILPGQSHVFGAMSDYLFWRKANYFARYLLNKEDNPVDITEWYK